MKKILLSVFWVVSLILSGVLGYCIGSNSNSDIYNDAEIYSQTFYAKITRIKENNFSVSGLSVNDINFRGKFNFAITDDTSLEWRYTEIQISDLNVGDIISITFNGDILETYPASIHGVSRIQLLEDEK